ncbi:LysR family transcriptional regulator [Luteitalea sp.]|uniref:LysR family transcriptional regulator n=1 Tax=Luteitalea sp. TaxID=2004800 RepID=UPI0025BD1CEF|nr:LysR family transcriptional regulator [Luteitalea sp.]
MRMAFLNYHHLRYFWATVKEGGVTRASRRLNVTQPTISSQIPELENVFDRPLLDRQSQKLVLTEAGQICYRYAEKIFEMGHDLVLELQGQPPSRPVDFTVGLANSMPKMMVHRLLQPALGLPDVGRVRCYEDRLEHLIDELASHHLDLVIADAPEPPNRKHKVYSRLLGESSVLFFGTERLASGYRRGFPRSLDGAPMLLPTHNTALRRALDRWFSEQSIVPNVVAEFEDPALMKVFGEASAGIFPALAAVEADVRRMCDVRALGTAQGVVERFYAMSTERRLKHPAVAAVSEGAKYRLVS